jgi:hypothetical protein
MVLSGLNAKHHAEVLCAAMLFGAGRFFGSSAQVNVDSHELAMSN